MKKLFQEFKNFAVRGNMIDMAVGIIIGTAFNNVVNTLVRKIVMPPLALITGEKSFADQEWILKPATENTEAIVIGYGLFIEVVIDFVIIALTIFMVIKAMNKLRTKAEDPKDVQEVTPKDIELLDQLKNLMEEQNELLRNSRKN
ncbi:MAG: large-conductance mechanosensitive channel protein MscL [Flavobacteriaceae bacterium]